MSSERIQDIFEEKDLRVSQLRCIKCPGCKRTTTVVFDVVWFNIKLVDLCLKLSFHIMYVLSPSTDKKDMSILD